ncbi:serine/threonine-protein kinase [Tengunoibacter tsumagoiensis]|uniref:Protein kinase domain-containing protein n=1 Tax=Tengunoibacter tsumagoiensis TaxID=2014871 RepID=A0A401ZVC9_9CHLR|nr:serine/threonine-protein kinase [Tengunoibacter tsumagoiensis]GCE10869.1 hypothetical protein KTT_07280 [Tengunoibacter tsumagoiensis]
MTIQDCENCGAANPVTARFCQNCATPLPFKHSTGTLSDKALLDGRYQLEILIGQGGMGAVYKAIDTRFSNRSVAVKEMSRSGLTPAQVQEAEASFERESQILAELLHPNLPRIYDHFTEGERSYLVMDFIEGQTIEEYIERRGSGMLPLEQVLPWADQLCAVLTYLHTHQPPIIFRDLKPSNVMISGTGHIYLIDFGIARVFKPGQSHDTVALGSPGYAAPEQYGKAQSTPRSDVYSLGALLHHLLTGIDPSEQPFFFQPASQFNSSVPNELSELLQRMLDMNAEKRPANAQEVANALRLLEQQRISGTLPSFTGHRPAVQPRSPSQAILQDAYRLYTQNRLPEALNLYDRAVQTDTNNALAWQGRGLTQALNAQHPQALASFEKALQLNPNLVTALTGKGTALNFLHRNREALEAFEKAIELEKDNAVAWDGKGAVLSALGQPEQALQAFDFALHFDSRMAQAWGNKGLVLRQLRRFPEALRAFDEALALDSRSTLYWNGKGMVLSEMRNPSEALKAYNEALRINSRYAPAWCGIGEIRYNQNNLKEALEAYERATTSDPLFVKAWERRAIVLTDMNRYSKALDSYNRALQIDPNYTPALNGKANVLYLLDRFQEALTTYDRAISLNKNIAQVWNGKGNVLYHLGDYGQALYAYERALLLNPRMVSALHNKALVLKQLERYEESLAAAEEAVRLAPNDADNWQRKAEALKKLRRKRELRDAEAQVARLRGEA